ADEPAGLDLLRLDAHLGARLAAAARRGGGWRAGADLVAGARADAGGVPAAAVAVPRRAGAPLRALVPAGVSGDRGARLLRRRSGGRCTSRRVGLAAAAGAGGRGRGAARRAGAVDERARVVRARA